MTQSYTSTTSKICKYITLIVKKSKPYIPILMLKKAIKLAHKSEFGREQQDHELLEQILVTVGKTL